MLKMLTLVISINFQPHLIQIRREMYRSRASLAFISCSNQAQGPLGRIILQ